MGILGNLFGFHVQQSSLDSQQTANNSTLYNNYLAQLYSQYQANQQANMKAWQTMEDAKNKHTPPKVKVENPKPNLSRFYESDIIDAEFEVIKPTLKALPEPK